MIFAPIQLALFLLVLVLAALLLVRIRRARLPSVPSCGACGYAVPHDQAQVCPECGGRYTIVGLRSNLYDPFAVWSTATTRGGLLIGAVLVLWLIGAIVIHQLGSRRLNYQSTSIVTMSTRTGGLLLPATGGTMLRMELTLDASGPSDSPPDTMVLTLRIPERSHNVPYLRLDAISRTVEVFGSGDPRRSMPYTSVSVDESLSQIGLPTDVALRTAVAKYLEQMLASAVTPMSAVQSGAASAYEANLTLPWFETFTGSTRVNTGLSQNAQLAVMISGIVATFLTIALWLVHCRMLLTADNLRRQRLIEADGVA